MKKIFIIILNWNGKKDTLRCLKSLKKIQNQNFKCQIIIVDNGSTDGSIEAIQKSTLRLRSGQKVKIIENKRNLGFAQGNNIGIKEALVNGADYVIILNNDTIVPRNFLDLLKNGADIVGPVIRFKNEKGIVYDYGGYLNWWIGRPKHHELPRHIHDLKFHNLDYLSGCCLLIKRKVFEKIGLFDGRYFLYFEDLDFCLRAKRAGFRIVLEPKVVIDHKLGGTAGRWSKTAIFHNLRSNLIFINRHLGWRRPIGYLYLALLSIKIMLDKVVSK